MKNWVNQTIVFGAEANAAKFLGEGWAAGETGFNWTLGQMSRLSLPGVSRASGAFIEITAFPRTQPEGPTTQRIALEVNGYRVGQTSISLPASLGFYLPPHVANADALDVMILHPDAFVAPTGGPDFAIAVSQVRVLGLAEPLSAGDPRSLATRPGHDGEIDIRQAISWAEATTGLPIVDFLTRFEMLAGNCEFGGIQRRCGAEPLSLLRFAGASIDAAIRGLDADFSGIGENLAAHISPDAVREWIISDPAYSLNYHTFVSADEVPMERIVRSQARRAAFLRRKFLEDLAQDEKIFVCVDPYNLPREAILPLFLALQRHGPHTLLWIGLGSSAVTFGTATEIYPRLIRGEMSSLTRHGIVSEAPVAHWLSVLVNAWLLRWGSKGHEATRADAAQEAGECHT